MDMRVGEERMNLRDLKEQQNEARKALADCFGCGTMKYKKSISRLNRMSKIEGRSEDQKHERQLQHLKKKHDEARDQENWKERKE